MRVVAFVSDLRDQSLVRAAISQVEFARDPEAGVDAHVVIVDLARHPDLVPAVRVNNTTARVICFGPHVDTAAAESARAAGADDVLPRSRFFRDIRAATGC